MATWHTVESARDQWADAPEDEGEDADATLRGLLEDAKLAVRAFAPTESDGYTIDEDGYIVPGDPSLVPQNYRDAQLIKCRIIWSAEKQSPTGTFDGGDYDLSTYSLERTFKQLLRPKQGRPVIA
jgi:hypothetical protein